jgi:hypothetical protein
MNDANENYGEIEEDFGFINGFDFVDANEEIM